MSCSDNATWAGPVATGLCERFLFDFRKQYVRMASKAKMATARRTASAMLPEEEATPSDGWRHRIRLSAQTLLLTRFTLFFLLKTFKHASEVDASLCRQNTTLFLITSKQEVEPCDHVDMKDCGRYTHQ